MALYLAGPPEELLEVDLVLLLQVGAQEEVRVLEVLPVGVLVLQVLLAVLLEVVLEQVFLVALLVEAHVVVLLVALLVEALVLEEPQEEPREVVLDLVGLPGVLLVAVLVLVGLLEEGLVVARSLAVAHELVDNLAVDQEEVRAAVGRDCKSINYQRLRSLQHAMGDVRGWCGTHSECPRVVRDRVTTGVCSAGRCCRSFNARSTAASAALRFHLGCSPIQSRDQDACSEVAIFQSRILDVDYSSNIRRVLRKMPMRCTQAVEHAASI